MSANAAPSTVATVESEPPQDSLRESASPWRYRMIAEADPGLLPRVIAPIAKLGLVPERCRFARRGQDLAEIEFAVSGLSRSQADHLRLVYAVMPPMRAVTLTAPGA